MHIRRNKRRIWEERRHRADPSIVTTLPPLHIRLQLELHRAILIVQLAGSISIASRQRELVVDVEQAARAAGRPHERLRGEGVDLGEGDAEVRLAVGRGGAVDGAERGPGLAGGLGEEVG